MIDALGAESLDDLQFITVSDMKALGMPGESMWSAFQFELQQLIALWAVCMQTLCNHLFCLRCQIPPVIQQRKFFAAYQSSGLPAFPDQTTDFVDDHSAFQENTDDADEEVVIVQARIGNRQRVRRKRWRELNNPTEGTSSSSENKKEWWTTGVEQTCELARKIE